MIVVVYLLIIATTVLGFLQIKNHRFYLPFLLMILCLSLIQYKTTKSTDLFNLNEVEKIEQLKRMNEYPPSAYRLANWIEARKESVFYFKIEKNFVGIFDITKYFYGLFLPLLFPAFLYGFFGIFKQRKNEWILVSAIPVSLLTIIGHSSFYGPISIYPLIYSSIVYGIYLIFNKITRHEK
ncbi:MAG TPA: hypothetical protein PLI45_01900 [Candidatus Woesebacteria bacterium]|nr:hypothetical protein [Candidatus Woesebacteria bacterium]